MLTRKLKMNCSEASEKGLDTKDSNKESNYNEESVNEHKAKKDHSLGLMFVYQIQSLIANTVKA